MFPVVNIVAEALGSVKVLVVLAGPVKAVNPLAVPPFAAGRIPLTPAVKDTLVQLLRLPLVGVPKTGATKVGVVERTTDPDPVEDVTPVPPFATGRVPVTPNVKLTFVQFDRLPLVGVPNAGVTSVGEVERTTDPVPVLLP